MQVRLTISYFGHSEVIVLSSNYQVVIVIMLIFIKQQSDSFYSIQNDISSSYQQKLEIAQKETISQIKVKRSQYII